MTDLKRMRTAASYWQADECKCIGWWAEGGSRCMCFEGLNLGTLRTEHAWGTP